MGSVCTIGHQKANEHINNVLQCPFNTSCCSRDVISPILQWQHSNPTIDGCLESQPQPSTAMLFSRTPMAKSRKPRHVSQRAVSYGRVFMISTRESGHTYSQTVGANAYGPLYSPELVCQVWSGRRLNHTDTTLKCAIVLTNITIEILRQSRTTNQ